MTDMPSRTASAAPARMLRAYVGCRTTRERNARGDGIGVLRFDEATGALAIDQLLGGLVNPSYLALAPDRRTLYTVHGDRTQASALRIDGASGHLSLLNTVETGGLNPVHLVLTPDARQLVVTNHLGATVVRLPIGVDGALRPVAQSLTFEGTPGPHRVEQKQAKPHFAAFDPSGRWLLVPDKGLDRVFTLGWDGAQLVHTQAMVAREGAGPRHLAFHPARPWVCIVNELDSTVSTCTLDAASGTLAPRQILSTLPDSFTGNSRAAAIAIDAAGRTLYASNRGHDSIAVFSIDATDGRLGLRQVMATQGRTPRAFTLSPSGRWLLALNEDSDSIVTLAVDAASGTLSDSGQRFTFGSPVCLVFGGALA